MQPDLNSGIHLTYCTNIHPGESWTEVRGQLETYLPELKSRIAPEQPFGVGLRLSAEAAEELLRGENLGEFKEWLTGEGLYLFTMNGFPYGSFHRERVKELVYAPDWRTEERVSYTLNLTRILAALLPGGIDGGISTSPVSYKRWMRQRSLKKEVLRAASRNMARVAFEMARIEEEEGKELHLDIEPEPDCLLENTRETVDFFTKWLFPVGIAHLAERFGLDADRAEALIRHHIRVCYDTCHFAVEYEDPAQTLEEFSSAGIQIGKTQISAALKVQLDQEIRNRKQVVEQLSAFDEPTYLHQVVERRSGKSLHNYRDLADALQNFTSKEAVEWRIHFHVPLFIDQFEGLHSTRHDIIPALERLISGTECRHFEVETYTWEVLPDELKIDLTGSIEREMNWVLGALRQNTESE